MKFKSCSCSGDDAGAADDDDVGDPAATGGSAGEDDGLIVIDGKGGSCREPIAFNTCCLPR